MLRSFRLANHRSFRDAHELLLMPSHDNDREVVPVAAVFGANASGKSNLLDGLQLMSKLVRSWSTREPGSGIQRNPFRLKSESLAEPSSFAVELVLDEVRYTYGFDFDDKQVIKEWLYAYPNNRRRILLDRDGSQIKFGSTVTQRTRQQVIEGLLTDDTLFLTVAARLKLKDYQPVADWFLRFLRFPGSSFNYHGEEGLARFIEQSVPDQDRFRELVRAADVGVSDITVESYTDDPYIDEEVEALTTMVERIEGEMADAGQERPDLAAALTRAQFRRDLLQNREQRMKLVLTHGGVPFGFADESEGTRSWLSLLPEVITSLGGGHTLVIDEIDTSLHPDLVRKLVGLFRDSAVNVGRAQLLFTTHDPFLLESVAGERCLKRDEVWFVQKLPDGASTLYPLTDFKPRNEHNLARRYLGGAYGAVPILDGFDQLGARATAD